MKTLVILLNILLLLCLIPAALAVMMSPMIFDAPGSTEETAPRLMFTAVVSLPLFLLAGQVLSWIFFAKKRYRTALYFSLLPLAALVGFALIYLGVG